MDADVYYPKSYDIIYRSGYIIGFIGILIFTFSYIFFNVSGMKAGVPIFYAGSLISSFFLLVWKKEIKIFIISCVIMGILLSAAYITVLKNPVILIISVGFVLVGLSGLYGKEAHCFHFFEGWILMWSFPILVVANLLIYGLELQDNLYIHSICSIAYIIVALLALSFLIKKLRQPLMQFCQN